MQLIARLRNPLGCTKCDIADSFAITERTVERYFDLLRDIGFVITKTKNRFRIEHAEKKLPNPEELIVFSLEEAALIRQAIEASAHHSPLQKTLLAKLYALTDMEELADTLYNQTLSRNISTVREAIKNQQQVLLKGYHSVNSNTTHDRLIEPISFHSYFQYVLGLEVNSMEVKQYKTERITEAVNTGISWKHKTQHQQKGIDTFGMSGTDPIHIKLKLTTRARHLLVEEHPDAASSITPVHGKFIYTSYVYSLEGVGRFVLGLPGEVEVLEPEELKGYVEGKVKGWKGENKNAPVLKDEGDLNVFTTE